MRPLMVNAEETVYCASANEERLRMSESGVLSGMYVPRKVKKEYTEIKRIKR